jgi:hypothetical protein
MLDKRVANNNKRNIMKMIFAISLSLGLATLALCLDNSNAPFFSLVERFDKGTHRAEIQSLNGEIVVKLAEGSGANYLKLFRHGEEIVTVYVNSETNQIEYVVLAEDTKANPVVLRSINSKGEVTGRVEVPLLSKPRTN